MPAKVDFLFMLRKPSNSSKSFFYSELWLHMKLVVGVSQFSIELSGKEIEKEMIGSFHRSKRLLSRVSISKTIS